jgi:DNA polymerase III gamma/tau subunit
VVSHHPLLAPPPYDGGAPWDDYVLPNGADAREVIATSPDVRVVLSGHLYLNKVQLENNVFHVSCAGLNIYPCEYKHFVVNKTGITMQSYEVPFPALIKKANKALAASTLASKYNRQKSDAILQLCEGEEQDQNAFLSLGSNKTIRPLSKKELKEQQKVLEERIQKEQESLKQGKDKASSDKKTDSKKPDDKREDKKPDDKKSDDKKSNDKRSGSKKSSDKKSNDKNSDQPAKGPEDKPTAEPAPASSAPADKNPDAPPQTSEPSADKPTEKKD